mmetsp:Transcript_60202/g.95622  ORF Transcript_60202/g.95622 Transcript_60202/m.95622 type:complete len:109 (-) Transcript_60202:1723-2049(-)
MRVHVKIFYYPQYLQHTLVAMHENFWNPCTITTRKTSFRVSSMHHPQLLHPTQAYLGSLAFRSAMACSSVRALADTPIWEMEGADAAFRTLSTSTVNLMASVAALVRR